MKKTITYREITIAIGILVAMVIALTLWTRIPDEKSAASATVEMNIPAPLADILTTAAKMFSGQATTALER